MDEKLYFQDEDGAELAYRCQSASKIYQLLHLLLLGIK